MILVKKWNFLAVCSKPYRTNGILSLFEARIAKCAEFMKFHEIMRFLHILALLCKRWHFHRNHEIFTFLRKSHFWGGPTRAWLTHWLTEDRISKPAPLSRRKFSSRGRAAAPPPLQFCPGALRAPIFMCSSFVFPSNNIRSQSVKSLELADVGGACGWWRWWWAPSGPAGSSGP